MIISFSGLDGSGKTTLSRLLYARLFQEHIPVTYVHLQNFSLFGKIGRLLDKSFPFLRKGIEDIEFSKKRSFKKKTFSFFRKASYLFDVVVFSLYAFFSGKKRVFICDRYFYDLAVQSMYLEMFDNKFSDYYLSLIPLPDIAIFLEISPKEALQRSQEKNLEFHNVKNSLYHRILKKYSFTHLKNTKLETTQKKILDSFFSLYRH